MMLDDAYANAAYIDGADGFPPRWEKEAEAFRASLGARAQLNVRYGPSDRQKFDFFQPEGVSRGTVVFVHGGYWKAFDKSYWSHLAAGPLARGYAVAMPSYDLCPDVRISEISTQIAAALTEVANRTQGAIVLSGHSAGGHLVARMTDPLLLGAEVRDRITRIVPISPVADLAPLLQTQMNDTLRLDEAEAEAESPMNMTPPHGVDVTVWVGAQERPAFLEQAENFARSWGAKQVVAEGKHHFDVIDPLAEPDSDLTKALLGS
ncbi:MAG TPA: alpha/beta hydrolase [Sulfitobacter sp.]|uniref:alpha/beta hydrolase n=1 Tax=Sulfitobacter sp. TaxID=1903071 RepID=UPI000EECEE62|nr:alpha/beta hydrolase [Sulfitobacter sp.]HCQ58397.1 alpha/beta hydrolase [Sulfitobacter sp.]|tara:strand:- start:229 stop:1017 length:789 start_codon:yes stop_codon:yes gene_type:complete